MTVWQHKSAVSLCLDNGEMHNYSMGTKCHCVWLHALVKASEVVVNFNHLSWQGVSLIWL